MARFTNKGESDIVCPPTDVYILRFIEATTPELADGFDQGNKPEHERKKVLRTQLTFKIVDCDTDPSEAEAEALAELGLEDWNGFEIKNYYTVGKDFNHELSKLGKVLKALLQTDYIDPGDDIDTDSLAGRRIKATIAPKKSGYPGIESPVKYVARRPRNAPAPAPAPKAVEPEYDDGADLFDEDAA